MIGKETCVRAIVKTSVVERITIEGRLRGRRVSGEARARLIRFLNGDGPSLNLPLKIANVLAHYWMVNSIRVSEDYRSEMIVWLPPEFREKIQKECMRHGWTLGQVAGSCLLASLADETLPRDVRVIMDELAGILPEEVEYRDRMPDDVLSLVDRLRVAFMDHEGDPDQGLPRAGKAASVGRLGCKAGCKDARVGR